MIDKSMKRELTEVFSKIPEIYAVWENTDLSSRYGVVFLNVVYEQSLNAASLRHNIVMELIPIEAKYEQLIEFCLRTPRIAFLTNNLHDGDFIIRKDGYETPNDALQFVEKDDTINKSKMERMHKFADYIENNPAKLEIVRRYNYEVCQSNRCSMTLPLYEEWQEMLETYSVSLMLTFMRSNIPRAQQLCILSPFVCLTRMLV